MQVESQAGDSGGATNSSLEPPIDSEPLLSVDGIDLRDALYDFPSELGDRISPAEIAASAMRAADAAVADQALAAGAGPALPTVLPSYGPQIIWIGRLVRRYVAAIVVSMVAGVGLGLAV